MDLRRFDNAVNPEPIVPVKLLLEPMNEPVAQE
jgi:hypothetical protein